MAPPEEFEAAEVSREQFVAMMRDLASGLPATYFSARIQEMPGAGPGPDRGEHYVLLSFGNAPMRDGKPSQLLLRALRGPEGWRVPSQELPLIVARWHENGTGTNWKRMLRALRLAGVREYPVNMSGLRLHTDRLADYVEGRADYASVYSR